MLLGLLLRRPFGPGLSLAQHDSFSSVEQQRYSMRAFEMPPMLMTWGRGASTAVASLHPMRLRADGA